MADREYQRLSRSHVRSAFTVAFASRCSLWLGADHLLLVDSNGYTETYKRFYFRDLQAFTFTLTKRRLVWNCILGIATGICLLGWAIDLLSSPPVTAAGIITGTIVTAIFAVPLLLNNLLGPTCRCYLKTAVQTEELPPLKRLFRARKIMARLRPLISQAQSQGGVAASAAAASEQTLVTGEGSALPRLPQQDINAPPPPGVAG
jgi:hypothetical protein